MINSDDTGLTQLTFDTNSDQDPAWSPDGTKIAFESDRAGNYDIWSINETALH